MIKEGDIVIYRDFLNNYRNESYRYFVRALTSEVNGAFNGMHIRSGTIYGSALVAINFVVLDECDLLLLALAKIGD